MWFEMFAVKSCGMFVERLFLFSAIIIWLILFLS